jgi:hypothetical protein
LKASNFFLSIAAHSTPTSPDRHKQIAAWRMDDHMPRTKTRQYSACLQGFAFGLTSRFGNPFVSGLLRTFHSLFPKNGDSYSQKTQSSRTFRPG